jgi:hypothetical protein
MYRLVRVLARRALGVRRVPTYYLPWISRAGLECVLLLSNIESRFRSRSGPGPFAVSARQYDGRGRLVREHAVELADHLDTAEVPLLPAADGYGFVAVDVGRIQSDLYVTLCAGDSYTATHGRGEFVERYPVWTRIVMAVIGWVLALAGLTIPAFARDQYVYVGADNRSHLLLMNLSNVTNRIRIKLTGGVVPWSSRLEILPPMGAHLLALPSPALDDGAGLRVGRLRAEGNAWFNFYMVGTGARDLAGPLSLMHVK